MRTTGEVLYYSIDEELNIVYKMKLKTLADETVEVHREISNGNHNGQEIVVVNQISEGIEYKIIDESTIEVNASEDLNTYLVPFNPTDTIQSILAGGGGHWLHECKCSLGSGGNASCTETAKKASNGAVTLGCKENNCQTCKLKLTWVKDNKEWGRKKRV